jgi:hypothetical protein
MSKHTPGPWYVLHDNASKSQLKIRGTQPGSSRFQIANILGPYCDQSQDAVCKETLSNASLIAAAPELLSFAQEFLSDYQSEEGMLSMKQYAKKAYEAITKATGSTP